MISVETHTSIDQASGSLGAGGIYLGGGTLIMRALNYGEHGFNRLVRSTDPALRQIASEGERIRIGAGVTMRQIVEAADLGFLAPVARQVGGPAIRNMATVGGNLFAHHPYGDLTVALLALDGRVQVAGGNELELETFLAQRSSFEGLVVSVSVMRPAGGAELRWRKVSRIKPKGVSVMSIAASLPMTASRVSGARVAFGAMADMPIRAKSVEQALEGASLDQNGIQNALNAVANDITPRDDALASGWYRREVAPVHLRRLLLNEGGR